MVLLIQIQSEGVFLVAKSKIGQVEDFVDGLSGGGFSAKNQDRRT